jgi:hypothetical protein
MARERATDGALELDLATCFFCSGEEDNCLADGIFVVYKGDALDQPHLSVVCYNGAHAQRLQLFDPVSCHPVLKVVGAYYPDWSIDKVLKVVPDGRKEHMVVGPPDGKVRR